MLWMSLAFVLWVVCFVLNMLIIKAVRDSNVSAMNVGSAYGIYGAWFTTAIAAFVLYITGAPTALSVIAAVVVFLVPYFLGQTLWFKGVVEAVGGLIKAHRVPKD